MNDDATFRPSRPGARRTLDIRQVRYNVTEWGDPAAPTFVYLHGWADTGESFQFVVDALQGDWHVVAPDWRGFGRSVVECSSYWFSPDQEGAEVVEIAGAAHMLHFDAPAALAATLEAFLSKYL